MKKRLIVPMLMIAWIAVVCPVVVCAAPVEITETESDIQSSTKSNKKYTEDELMDLAVKYYRKKSGSTGKLSVISFDALIIKMSGSNKTFILPYY